MEYRFVKGMTEKVRDLKNILNVDFSPKKTCTYDCLTCTLGRTNFLTTERKEFHPAEDIVAEIRSYILENEMPEHIMLTGSGEPTLYSGLGKLTGMIKGEFKDLKTMLYTNLTLLHQEKVRNEVALCDIVAGNFNTVIEDEFKKMYRPHEFVRLTDVMEGIRRFRAEYSGRFELDTRFMRGLNDNDRNADGLREFMMGVRPDKYHVIDAKFGGQALDEDFAGSLRKKFDALPFNVEYHL